MAAQLQRGVHHEPAAVHRIREQADLRSTGLEYAECLLRGPVTKRLGEQADLAAEAVGTTQPRHEWATSVSPQTGHEIGQDRTGLHRRQLIGVAHDDQPGLRA